MTTSHQNASWQVQDRFLELHSRWFNLIGEHLRDHQGNLLEYWRIEKADSVIILPLQADQILLPSPSYRPGIDQMTLDFPGGRVPIGTSPAQAAITTLQRELGIETSLIRQLIPMNSQGWAINSSFSNQKLYGFVAHLQAPNPSIQSTTINYPANSDGIQQLLQALICLQCRSILLNWWITTSQSV